MNYLFLSESFEKLRNKKEQLGALCSDNRDQVCLSNKYVISNPTFLFVNCR